MIFASVLPMMMMSATAGYSMWMGQTQARPPYPAGLFSEGGEVIKLRIEGSLTIPIPEIKRV